MELSYWESRWRKGKTGFHADWVNPALKKYWSEIPAGDEHNVLVPLCGKSPDLIWLRDRGHHVWGVEFVDLACQSLFVENGIPYEVEQRGNWKIYRGNNLDIIQGDFFKLPSKMLPPVNAVYDRAAVVALPPDKRIKYTEKIRQLARRGCSMLVHTFEYDQEKMSGPPFSVWQNEIEVHYSVTQNFVVTCLDETEKIDQLKKFQWRGLNSIREKTYHIRRNQH